MHCAQKRTYGGDIQGAFAEFMPARAKDCVLLPENISYLDGAFYTCGASTGYYSLKRANLLGGERGIMGGAIPSAKDLQLQADGKGYNEFQMNKIFNTMYTKFKFFI